MVLIDLILNRSLIDKLKDIELVVCDVDGVLTNGQIFYYDNSTVHKAFNVKDGMAVKLLGSIGIETGFISGSDSKATSHRAKSLSIRECHTNVFHKNKTLIQIQERLSVLPKHTLYIGDDINDLEVIPNVSLFVTPNDANHIVKRSANFVLRSSGGEGVLREVADMIINIKQFNQKSVSEKIIYLFSRYPRT